MQDRSGYTLAESAERYRQTLIFNNDLLKRNYAERYEFNTTMQIDRKRRFGVSEENITKYKERRARGYDGKFAAYSNRLDMMVEPSVSRYVSNIRAAFGYD